jgi:ankyrin repeat protein
VLKNQPALVRKVDADGTTLLHWAADTNNTAAAKVIMASGGVVNARNRKGVTPLQVAASLGNSEIADLLIRSGASTSSKDKQGRTALDLAILHNKLRTAAIIASPLPKK